MEGGTDTRGAIVGALMGTYVGYQVRLSRRCRTCRTLDSILLLGPKVLKKELVLYSDKDE